MTRLRFSIAQLMGIVLYLGFGFAALRNADEFWASASYTLAMAMIAAALVGAFARNGTARMTWVGFAVFGWAYLLVARLPDLNTPSAGQIHGPYLLIEWGFALLVPYIYPPGAAFNGVEYDEIAHSLGVIFSGLVGAAVGRLLAMRDERPNP